MIYGVPLRTKLYFGTKTRIGGVKTSIDNTTGQRSLFLDSSFLFSTRLQFVFFNTNFKISTRVFFFFREHIFCKSRLIFLLHSMYFTSFDLSIVLSTCFYYWHNFVRNGTP